MSVADALRPRLLDAVAKALAGDWPAAHLVVQDPSETDATAAWIHAVVHRMEGDLGNARYWYGRAGRAWPSAPDPGAEIEALAQMVAVARDDGGSA